MENSRRQFFHIGYGLLPYRERMTLPLATLHGPIGGIKMSDNNNTLGCVGTLGVLVLIGGIISAVQKCSGPADDQNGFPGPIPVRFQGAYNSYACGSGATGLVTVGGDDINYGGAAFDVTAVVSESEGSVTLQGEPVAANGRENTRTFVITYAPVGGMARLDGAEFERCSQY